MFPKQGEGVKALRKVEQKHGFFVWATEFSNMHSVFKYKEKPIVVGGVTYSNSENYFQSCKFIGSPDANYVNSLIRGADPAKSYTIGRKYTNIRGDWKHVRENVMFEALTAKFAADENARNILLQTGDLKLVQLKPNDAYWGTGPDGCGNNKLGNLVTRVRTKILENFDSETKTPVENDVGATIEALYKQMLMNTAYL